MTVKVYVPTDTTACALGADAVAGAIAAQARDRDIDIELVRSSSRGLFWLEPLIEVESGGRRMAFGPVSMATVAELIAAGFPGDCEHPLALGPVEELPWLKQQQRLTFSRAGLTDPLSIEAYRALEGFDGLEKALTMSPQGIVDEVKESGLRGRGGAAFPTGIKWQTVLDTAAEQKYIVANADEGDSGTFADRLLMEGDPYQLIEGMAISGLAVGATEGYIYLRSEYPRARRVLEEALARAEAAGFLGAGICGSDKDFQAPIYAVRKPRCWTAWRASAAWSVSSRRYRPSRD
jgi:formate dehydrogenase iron-sulfur subunit